MKPSTIDGYLAALERRLKGLPRDEVSEALLELRGHLMDHAAELQARGAGIEDSEQAAVNSLGPVRRVASSFVDTSVSPRGRSRWTPAFWAASLCLLPLLYSIASYVFGKHVPGLGPILATLTVAGVTLAFRRRFAVQLILAVYGLLLLATFIRDGVEPDYPQQVLKAYREDYRLALAGHEPLLRNAFGETVARPGEKLYQWSPVPVSANQIGTVPVVPALAPLRYNMPGLFWPHQSYYRLPLALGKGAAENWIHNGPTFLREFEPIARWNTIFRWTGPVVFLPQILYLGLVQAMTFHILLLARRRFRGHKRQRA